MNLELISVQSNHPQFQPPTRRNGDPLEPVSIMVQGEFVVARYVGWEPVEGPDIDEFFLDVFYNTEGREVFRATGRMIPSPPEPPSFLLRLRYALCLMFKVRPQYT
jgi:hypothetical protein